jgi:galactoside O-acetyltransferase
MNNGFYTDEELQKIGFKHIGENCLISRKASFYLQGEMTIGNNVRIDDYCILLGNITIGSYIHICAYTGLHASSGSITIEDFSNISSRAAIYAASDDVSAPKLLGAVVASFSKELTGIYSSNIVLGKHSAVGTGSTLLPGAELGEGSVLGTMSLANRKLKPWWTYFGIPAKRISARDKSAILQLEREFQLQYGGDSQ